MLTDLRYQKIRRPRAEMLEHLRTFELTLDLAVGIWYFAPGGSRFHARYVPDRTIEERLEMAAEMARFGVTGIEAHYPFEANEENVHLYKKLEEETGIRLINTGPFIFYDRVYEFGSLSSPIRAARDQAQQTLIANLKFVRDNDIMHCGIWPGIDGYTYPLGTLFYQMWDFFEGALAEAMDEVPGVRVAIEPKPYEPAPNNIYRTTTDGILLCRDVEARLKHPENRRLLDDGRALVAMQPEIGHILMGYEDPAYAFSRAARDGRLAHTHWNSQPLGNYDQDLNVGVVGWEQSEAALYALKTLGYREYLGIDINPERMPVLKAVEINARVLRSMNDRIGRLPDDRILACYYEPDDHRGDLELILADARA